MKQKSKKHFKFSALCILAAAICLILTIIALAYPYVRKSDSIKLTANTAFERLDAMASSYAVLCDNEIKSLAGSPTAYPQYYQKLSISLSKLNETLGYKRFTIVTKQGNKVVVLADSRYRVGGDEHLMAGAELPSSIYRGSSSTISKVLDGKATGGFSNDLLTNTMGASFVAAYLPIRSSDGTVTAVLVADCDVGSTAYNMVGFLDLNLLGIISLLGVLLFGGLAYLSTRFSVIKANKQEAKYESTSEQTHTPTLLEPTATDASSETILPEDNMDDPAL